MVKMTIGTLLGAAGGFAWYWFVGCVTGSCWISSNPVLSTGYWALFGWVAGGGGSVLDRWFKRAVARFTPSS